ncbi:MAG: hypothetical protein JWN02_2588, partial [Acidobacteria bacterium]|nr:hypothetical protein [Acidobacteriota bacterium]
MITAARGVLRFRDGEHTVAALDGDNENVTRSLSLVLLLAALLVSSPTAVIAQPVRGGALPAPLPLFPVNNWWNADVTSAPVDPRSAALIAFIGTSRGMHPDFGGDSGDPAAPIYGMPYVTVPGTQPLVPVTFDYDDESDPGAP